MKQRKVSRETSGSAERGGERTGGVSSLAVLCMIQREIVLTVGDL